MPIHESWKSMHQAMISKYGEKKGESVFYAYMRKHGYDETKPRSGQRSKEKTIFEDVVSKSMSEEDIDKKITQLQEEKEQLQREINSTQSVEPKPESPIIEEKRRRIDVIYEEIKVYVEAKVKLNVFKSFTLTSTLEQVDYKTFYGAVMPIIGIEIKSVAGEENYFVEGFISAPIKDLQGETVDIAVLHEWARECIAAPHNLVWLNHDSPYKKPENIDKPAILRFIDSRIGELTDRHGMKHSGLWVKGVMNKLHPEFGRIWEAVKTGFINSFSTEFMPLIVDPVHNIIQKAKYLASCLVMAPANDLATITSAYAKSFTGTEINMESKASIPGQTPPISPVVGVQPIPPAVARQVTPTVAPIDIVGLPGMDLDANSLEALLIEQRRAQAQLLGPPVPGVPGVGVQPIQQTPQVPQTPQTKNPLEDKIDQMTNIILGRIGGIENRLTTIETVVPRPEPEPTPKEIDRVLKYLAKKGESFYQPPVSQPTAVAGLVPPATKAVEPIEIFTREEVDIMILEALQNKDVVRKAFTVDMAPASNSDSDLSAKSVQNEHSVEGMLKTRDRIFGIMEINETSIPVYDKR